jgi:hypothetical protein
MPPVRVWSLQAMHFIMVAALLSAWRYERAGGTIALFASVVLLGAVAGPRLWLFLTITVPPALGFIYCGPPIDVWTCRKVDDDGPRHRLVPGQ